MSVINESFGHLLGVDLRLVRSPPAGESLEVTRTRVAALLFRIVGIADAIFGTLLVVGGLASGSILALLGGAVTLVIAHDGLIIGHNISRSLYNADLCSLREIIRRTWVEWLSGAPDVLEGTIVAKHVWSFWQGLSTQPEGHCAG